MPETQRWEIDGTRSKLAFKLRHLVVSEIAGAFARWGGIVSLDPEHANRSQVAIWVDLASVDTGSEERDAQLRSSEFFDVARFPRAQFTSTDIALRADGEATVAGQLRLHGTTELVEIAVTRDPIMDRRQRPDARRLRHARQHQSSGLRLALEPGPRLRRRRRGGPGRAHGKHRGRPRPGGHARRRARHRSRRRSIGNTERARLHLVRRPEESTSASPTHRRLRCARSTRWRVRGSPRSSTTSTRRSPLTPTPARPSPAAPPRSRASRRR